MKLTAGLACHDDFHGVAFTIQSLKIHHALIDEFVVVDNNPGSEQGQATKVFCKKHRDVKYVPFEVNGGTSHTRGEIFRQATGDAVLVSDCHVLYYPGAIARLKQLYGSNPDTKNLYSGPMAHESGLINTHLSDKWGEGMWGQWASAWSCTCKKPQHFYFTKEAGQTQPRDLLSHQPIAHCRYCKQQIPSVTWEQHEGRYLPLGFRPLGINDDTPFEIPGMGLGSFSCMKHAWLGFNANHRRFGGEELYLHEKFRRAGHQAICLPYLKWWHRFQRPGGAKYHNTMWDKMRNYVLEFQELGLDLEPVRRHFVDELKLKVSHYEALLADAVNAVHPDGHDKAVTKTTVTTKTVITPRNPPMIVVPGYGVGSEFKKLCSQLAIDMPPNCTCNALCRTMDEMGPEGVRASKEQLAGQIKANADNWGWTGKLAQFAKAGPKALLSGLAFKVNWLDPIPGMLDVAITRAEKNPPDLSRQGKPALRLPAPCGTDQFPAAGRQPNQLGWYSFAARRHPGATFLDVGAGMGAGMAYLQYLGAQSVRGFDTDPRLKDLPQMTVGESPLAALGANAADVVTCMDTIEHVLEDKALFHELLQLAPTVYISTPNLARAGGKNGYHAREYTIAEFSNIFRPDELWVASPDGWYHLQQLLDTPATTTPAMPDSPSRSVRCLLTQETWPAGQVPLDHVFNEGSPDKLEWAHFCGVFKR